MDVQNIGIVVEKLSYKINKVALTPGEKIELKPTYHREVRKSALEGDSYNLHIALSISITSTPEDPKPFDVDVGIVGIYNVKNVCEGEEKLFIIDATKELYPYIRSAVSNLTANAFINPIILPLISGPLFPEDRLM